MRKFDNGVRIAGIARSSAQHCMTLYRERSQPSTGIEAPRSKIRSMPSEAILVSQA